MKDWEKAIQLEEFVGNYIPRGYRESIRRFDYIPSITKLDYTVFENAYKNGTLLDHLESYERYFAGMARLPFNKPYIIDAITTYFDKEAKKHQGEK